MMSHEITDEIFEKSVQDYTKPPKEPQSSYSRYYEKISMHSYEHYDEYFRIVDDWYDDDNEEKERQNLAQHGACPTPQYNQSNRGHTILPIEDILEEPNRKIRPEKIIILLRGGPGAGKTFLAKMIIKKEKEMGNHRCKLITPNRYYHNTRFVRDFAERYLNALQAEAKEVLEEGYYTFVILEMEGHELNPYNRITDIAKAEGYTFYGIDIHQPFEICLKYCRHARAYNDVKDICKEVKSSPVPYYHKVLDPIELVAPGWRASQPPPVVVPPPKPEPVSKWKKTTYEDEYGSEEESFSCYG